LPDLHLPYYPSVTFGNGNFSVSDPFHAGILLYAEAAGAPLHQAVSGFRMRNDSNVLSSITKK
jgi:hypothetical protein